MNVYVIIEVKKYKEFDMISIFYLNHFHFSNVLTNTTVILKDKMLTHFYQTSTYVETRQLIFTSKIFEKHLWKSDLKSMNKILFIG